jgi:putative transposase
MKIHRSYKFRLSPTKEQIAMLKQHGGNSRFVWNKLLEYANATKKETGKYPNQFLLQKQILQLKKANDFISISHSQPIQINAMRLADTFARTFSPETIGLRNKKAARANAIKDEEKKVKALEKALNFGFPKFKSRNKSNDSLFYPQNFIIKKSRIHFPKLGWISYIKHRDIEGEPKSITITRDGNQYYVSVMCELKIKEKIKPDLDKANIAGIDVGLDVFAVLSDGGEIKNPRTLKRHLKKLIRENRRLARKDLKDTGKKTFYGKEIKESSKNRDKQIIKVQNLHRKIRNIRKDFLHKTSHHIITTYDGVITETLDILGMLKKSSRAMNRSILDVSWYEFIRQLEYKSSWNSKYFCKIDQYFPSTQKCSKCGSLAHLKLEDRVYSCPVCGAVMGRDANASVNIKNEGMRILRNPVNTLATQRGINACGSDAIASGVKQEKRRFRHRISVAA